MLNKIISNLDRNHKPKLKPLTKNNIESLVRSLAGNISLIGLIQNVLNLVTKKVPNEQVFLFAEIFYSNLLRHPINSKKFQFQYFLDNLFLIFDKNYSVLSEKKTSLFIDSLIKIYSSYTSNLFKEKHSLFWNVNYAECMVSLRKEDLSRILKLIPNFWSISSHSNLTMPFSFQMDIRDFEAHCLNKLGDYPKLVNTSFNYVLRTFLLHKSKVKYKKEEIKKLGKHLKYLIKSLRMINDLQSSLFFSEFAKNFVEHFIQTKRFNQNEKDNILILKELLLDIKKKKKAAIQDLKTAAFYELINRGTLKKFDFKDIIVKLIPNAEQKGLVNILQSDASVAYFTFKNSRYCFSSNCPKPILYGRKRDNYPLALVLRLGLTTLGAKHIGILKTIPSSFFTKTNQLMPKQKKLEDFIYFFQNNYLLFNKRILQFGDFEKAKETLTLITKEYNNFLMLSGIQDVTELCAISNVYSSLGQPKKMLDFANKYYAKQALLSVLYSYASKYNLEIGYYFRSYINLNLARKLLMNCLGYIATKLDLEGMKNRREINQKTYELFQHLSINRELFDVELKHNQKVNLPVPNDFNINKAPIRDKKTPLFSKRASSSDSNNYDKNVKTLDVDKSDKNSFILDWDIIEELVPIFNKNKDIDYELVYAIDLFSKVHKNCIYGLNSFMTYFLFESGITTSVFDKIDSNIILKTVFDKEIERNFSQDSELSKVIANTKIMGLEDNRPLILDESLNKSCMVDKFFTLTSQSTDIPDYNYYINQFKPVQILHLYYLVEHRLKNGKLKFKNNGLIADGREIIGRYDRDVFNRFSEEIDVFHTIKDLFNLKYENGRTCLHFAVIECQIRTVAYLLYHGMDPKLKDNSGKSPVSLNKEFKKTKNRGIIFEMLDAAAQDNMKKIRVLAMPYLPIQKDRGSQIEKQEPKKKNNKTKLKFKEWLKTLQKEYSVTLEHCSGKHPYKLVKKTESGETVIPIPKKPQRKRGKRGTVKGVSIGVKKSIEQRLKK